MITEVQNDTAIALFKLYERLPLTSIVSFITVILIMTFFVTSSDSGSLVIDSLASGGASNTPVWQRVFWATLEGLVAAALLIAGGLSALQTMSITSALPFAIIMVLAAIGMWRALSIEGHREASLSAYMHSSQHKPGNWKKRLAGLIHYPDYQQVADFIKNTAYPAMQNVETVLRDKGWPVSVFFDDTQHRAYIEVVRDEELDFIYEIRMRGYAMPTFAYPQMASNEDGDKRYYRAEIFMRRGGAAYDIFNCDQQEVIDDILNQFEKYLHFIHISPGILPWKMQEHDDMLNEQGELNDERLK